jgi:hypothetical protein
VVVVVVVESVGLKNVVIGVCRKGKAPLTFQEKIRRKLGSSGGDCSAGRGSGLLFCVDGDEIVFRRRGGGLTSGVLLLDLLPRVDIFCLSSKAVKINEEC